MVKHVLPLAFLGVGVFILVQVIMPLLSYKLWEITSYRENIALISPTFENQQVLGVSLKNIDGSFPAFVSDYQRTTPVPYSEFNISVPSIKLENIKVMVDTNSFEQNLAHMPGTSLPGERGNVFITGHSSLPQFYRPGNFKAIFANLPKVKKGDEILVEASGQKFAYVVQGLKIVDPKETWVINPPDSSGRYLTLMTCVPPGLYLKRLIVLAELK